MSDDKKQKLLIALGIVAIAVCIFIFINLEGKAKSEYIVVNDKVLGYVNKKWYNVSNNSAIFDDYRFKLFNKNEDKGNFELRYFRSSWYFFDKNRDSHKFQGSIFAYAGDRKLKLEKIEKKDFNTEDLNKINDALKDKEFSINSIDELSTFDKAQFDFNDDGKLETIYSINNINSNEAVDRYFTSVIYVADNTSKVLIYDDGDSERKYDLYIYSLDYIFNMDDEYNLLMTGGKDLDINSSSITIFKYNKKSNNLDEVKSLKKDYITLKHNKKDDYGLTIVLIIVAGLFIGILVYSIIKQKKAEQNKI